MTSPVIVEGGPCSSCLGWGYVLGTDTLETFGDICPCGCDIHRPTSPAENAQLQAAHDRARVKAATAVHMAKFDAAIEAVKGA